MHLSPSIGVGITVMIGEAFFSTVSQNMDSKYPTLPDVLKSTTGSLHSRESLSFVK
jgi:hypothetical protein